MGNTAMTTITTNEQRAVQTVMDAYLPSIHFTVDEATQILRDTAERIKGQHAITGKWRGRDGRMHDTADAALMDCLDAVGDTDHYMHRTAVLMTTAYAQITELSGATP